MTKTFIHRLRDACRERGYQMAFQPDEPRLSPPYSKWWGCVYDPESGHVAALVTAGSGRLVRLLLQRLDEPPPIVRRVRRGIVVERELGSTRDHSRRRGRVEVEFEDGTRREYVHPIGVSIRVDWPVREVYFEDHDGPLFLWGREHVPRRLTFTEPD